MKHMPNRKKTEDELHEEILREAEKEAARIGSKMNDHGEEYKEKTMKTPLIWLAALFFILIFLLWAVPLSFIKMDPEPKEIPKLTDIFPDEKSIEAAGIVRPNSTNILAYVDATEPAIKQAATKIATESCDSKIESYKVCQAKAVYYFVRDNFAYVAETDEYIQTPKEMIYTRGGDCDDYAVILASMEQAIGVPTRFAFMPEHVYIEIYLEDALSKYKQEDGWIIVDATCKNCEFGKMPAKYKALPKRYVW